MKEDPLRSQLARYLRKVPRGNRTSELQRAQANERYWEAKGNKLNQSAEWSEDRTELYWQNKNVFHGTTSVEIDKFNFADESTIGNRAIYFTIDPKLAMDYAKLRTEEKGSEYPYLYEVRLENIKLQNWAQSETVLILKEKLLRHLQKVLQKLDSSDFKDFSEKYNLSMPEKTVRYAINRTITAIQDHKNILHGGNIRTVAQGIPGVFFQEFVESNGFDGIITIESGDDGKHTARPGISVVIFNPGKITAQRPYKLELDTK